VVVEYETEELDLVLEALERCNAHLTAAIVSKDIVFQNKVRVRVCCWYIQTFASQGRWRGCMSCFSAFDTDSVPLQAHLSSGRTT
jgi:hypothetical protein